MGSLSGLGLSTYEHVSGAHSLPFAVLGNVESIEYSKNFGGGAEIHIPLWIMVSRSDDASAQRALDAYVSVGTAGSVYSALNAATSTSWRDINIVNAGAYGTAELNNAPALAVAINLIISA
jgi:hypothetical protein